MERDNYIDRGKSTGERNKMKNVPLFFGLAVASVCMINSDKNDNPNLDNKPNEDINQRPLLESFNVLKFEIAESPFIFESKVFGNYLDEKLKESEESKTTTEETLTPIPFSSVGDVLGSTQGNTELLPENVPSGKYLIAEESSEEWIILGDCETGDGEVGKPFYINWTYKAEEGSGYDGAFQFDRNTWKSLNSAQGYEFAFQAPSEIQIAAFRELLARDGWSSWPSCSSRMFP